MAEDRSGKLPPEYKHAQFPAQRPSKIPTSLSEEQSLAEDDLALWRWYEMVETLRRNRRKLLSYPGVTGVDVGYQLNDEHEYQQELAIRVHVERKLPEDYLKKTSRHDLLPETLPSPIGNSIPVDVIEAEYRLVNGPPAPSQVIETPRVYANRRKRINPLVGGISIGSPQTSVGTLGALVWDKTDGRVCILSNWHVLAGDLRSEIGTPCFQPGPFDRGRTTDVVARLKRWSFNRQTDAALAELTGNRHYCAGEIVDLFQPIAGIAPPYLGMEVLKSARSTGRAWGFVDGLYFSAALQYSNGLLRVFEEQIHIAPRPPEDDWSPIRPISEPGDSGSVWVTKANGEGYQAVGLHFAGDLPNSAFGEFALANPMEIVADRLEFSFRPVFLEIRDEDVNSLSPTSRIDLEGKEVRPTGAGGERRGSGPETGDQALVGPPGR